MFGPMPCKGEVQSSVALDFERRAKRMKDRLLGGEDEPEKPQRESWMMELPPELQHVGLEARTFKKRSGPENKDRSIWTDTPADRERKARERQEAKERGETSKTMAPRLSKKDLDMAEKVSKYNDSQRGESLLSMHSKKMKRKAEEDSNKPGGKETLRPRRRSAGTKVFVSAMGQSFRKRRSGEAPNWQNQGKAEVSFTLNEELTTIETMGEKASMVRAPREHPFTLQTVGGQTLAVYTETLSGQSDAEGSGSGTGSGPDKIALEGVVVQRAECRPAVNEHYMRLKRLQIEESLKPHRFSKQLEKAVTTNYKPVANHTYNLDYEKKKKEEGKRARADKQQVLDMLFSAFEKHQYYNIKDLVDITKQPVIYLKEILRDIGIYNVKGTHKNTWELKPEYRHYQSEEKSD
ncbi:hypothetical protein QTP86_012818 [Hemibagrus guttatus]|nr:hypothetical protein QTP86_012818 [Hemibagrus guttatus]